jgi:ABC-2 type transport system ATP-binding protein
VHAFWVVMKQRLGIANALLSPRELLVLDEPTNGLDPQGTREVRNLVRSLAADGTTVFVSSHLLAEVEQICTHAAIMSAGRLVAQGPLPELRRSGSTSIRLVTPDAGAAMRVLARLGLSPEPAPAQSDGEVVTAALAALGQTATGDPAPEEIVDHLVQAGVRVRGFAVERESLEDRFVALTGEGFDVAQ